MERSKRVEFVESEVAYAKFIEEFYKANMQRNEQSKYMQTHKHVHREPNTHVMNFLMCSLNAFNISFT